MRFILVVKQKISNTICKIAVKISGTMYIYIYIYIYIYDDEGKIWLKYHIAFNTKEIEFLKSFTSLKVT